MIYCPNDFQPKYYKDFTCTCGTTKETDNPTNECLYCLFGPIKSYYVYLWKSPYNEIFYVGKGSYCRCVSVHLLSDGSLAQCEKERLDYEYIWVQIVAHELDENKAFTLESALIHHCIDLGCPLQNQYIPPEPFIIDNIPIIASAKIWNEAFGELFTATYRPDGWQIMKDNPDIVDTYESNDETGIRYGYKDIWKIMDNMDS